MAQSSHHRFARLAAAVVAAFVVLVGAGASASAGGWAVGSLDAIPEATAGETVQVGFTILQHGVTPADLDADVGIEITNADGTIGFFAAEQDAIVGHYTASVTLPTTPGEYAWNIRMGWFGPHDLGTLPVSSASDPTNSTTAMWSRARWIVLALTAVLAVVAISDVAVTRRHTRALPS